MAIFGALGTARSGLVATGAALSVIGNNIANVNTIGFKGSRTDFADLLSAQGGGGSAAQIGLGTRIGRVSADFSQGNIESTGRPTDLAIEGNGFFVVSGGDGNLYTRAGNFRLDADGKLVTNEGQPVQGFALNNLQQAVGAPTDITVTGASSQPVPTTSIALKSNLRADSELIPGRVRRDDLRHRVRDLELHHLDQRLRLARREAYAEPLLHPHRREHLGLQRRRRRRRHRRHGGPVSQLVGQGQLQFNSDGSLNTFTEGTPVNVTFTGATAQTIALNFGTPNADPVANPGLGTDGITQFAGPSAVGFQSQNGFGAGQLLSLEFSEAGVVTGVFDNGQTRPLFQLALANFTAPDGLTPARQRALSRVGRLRLARDRHAAVRRSRQHRRGRRRALERRHRAAVHRPDLDPAELPGERPRDHVERYAAERPHQHRPVAPPWSGRAALASGARPGSPTRSSPEN